MSILHIILPILVGSLIGYCTNYIAIKMLFRPHKAVYIGKHQLPFTPGIIPKNQKRMANAVGDAVKDQLLTRESLIASLGDGGTIEKLAGDLTNSIYQSDKRVDELFTREGACEETVDAVSGTISRAVMEKVGQVDLNAAITKVGDQAMGSLFSASPMLGRLLGGDLRRSIYDKIAGSAQKYIDEKGEDTVKRYVREYLMEMTEKPVAELLKSGPDQAAVQAFFEDMIRDLAGKYGSKLLDSIDIKGIVSSNIEAMDVDELEALLMSVMKQELQAVINLGALIGAVIGVINIFL